MSSPGDDDGADGPGDRRRQSDSAGGPTRDTDQQSAAAAEPGLDIGEPSEGPSYRTEPADDSGLFSDEFVLFVRDLTTSVLAVVLLGAYIFMISGVWPPMVAIESGSMEPNMEVNDIVFVMDSDRFQPGEAQGESGVVTAEVGAETGYSNYGGNGDVIVFAPDGNENRTPVIHRAMFWVEEGENWFDRANEEFVGGADSCEEISACEAPHDGFITKGDANSAYDQAGNGNMEPVKPEWVVGTAEVRVPRLGWLRLRFQ